MQILVSENEIGNSVSRRRRNDWEAVADGLKGEGYAVDWVKDGNSAIIALDTTPFSLVILDLGLPGKDGLAVVKEIRFRKNHTPVLVTTARDTVNDRIEGLGCRCRRLPHQAL